MTKFTPEYIAKTGTESAHQKALFAHIAVKKYENPELYGVLRYLHHIPNGGGRDIVTAGRLKAEGVKPGVCDLFLPLPKNVLVDGKPKFFCGLYIEMKKPGKLADTSEEQDDFIEFTRGVGYFVMVCDSWEFAWEVIDWYLTSA